MQHFDVGGMVGPSAVMAGGLASLDEAIEMTQERFPGLSFCVVGEWVWLDLDAPDLVVQELASEGKKPVMLLVFEVLYDSSISNESHWFRSTPLIDFTEQMFFQTENKLYILLGQGRRKTMSLSTVVRLF